MTNDVSQARNESESGKTTLMKFAIKTADVRVIDSQIGKAIPICDIARALGYDYNSLKGIIERNEELFAELMVSVTLTINSSQSTRGGKKNHTITRDIEMRALNLFGVVGLLFKLDYNRIQDAEKRLSILRFQEWAIRVLGEATEQKQPQPQPQPPKSRIPALNPRRSNLPKEKFIFKTVPAGIECLGTAEIQKRYNVSRTTIAVAIWNGKIDSYYDTQSGIYGGYRVPVIECEKRWGYRKDNQRRIHEERCS